MTPASLMRSVLAFVRCSHEPFNDGLGETRRDRFWAAEPRSY
jgi:hypothetical protein